jgi:hypothetical protein
LIVRSLTVGGDSVAVAPDERVIIDARDVTLDAILADGTPIGFFLNTDLFAGGLGYFNPGATITAVGWVPVPCNDADLAEPFAVLDLADVVVFVGAFLAQSPAADFTGDGVVDLADIAAFVDAFTAGCGQ